MGSNWRVKLYRLDLDHLWQDIGVGELRISGSSVQISDESSEGSFLHNYTIGREIYRRQGDSILTWTELDIGTFAISFSEASEAQMAWEQICARQGRCPQRSLGDLTELPVPCPSNLSTILQVLQDPMLFREELLNILRTTNFVDQLRLEFIKAEEARLPELPLFSGVYKHLLPIMNEELIEKLLSDEYFIEFFGALEYDSDIKNPQYRVFLQNSFANVLEITDAEFVKKVHFAHRLSFFNESPSFKLLDEHTAYFMAKLFSDTLRFLVQCFLESEDLQGKLLSKIESGSQTYEGLQFLYEVTRLPRDFCSDTKQRLFSFIIDKCLLQLVAVSSLSSEQDEALQSFVCDITWQMMQEVPLKLRSFLLEDLNSQESPLLIKICERALDYETFGKIQQCSDLLKVLLNQDNRLVKEFICDKLLAAGLGKLRNVQDNEENELWTIEFLNILTYAISKSSEEMRVFIMVNNVISKVISLHNSRSKAVKLAVLQFMRGVIEKNDEHLNVEMVNINALKFVFDMWIECGNCENMIFSGVCAIVKLIDDLRISSLKEHIFNEHLPRLTPGLKSVYQGLDKKNINDVPAPAPRVTVDLKADELFIDEWGSPHKKQK